MKRIICFLLAVTACLTFASCNRQGENGEHDDIVMQTEHFSLTEDVFQYYMNLAVVSFYNTNYTYMEYLDLDLTRPLKEQKCTSQGDEDYTWFEFFANNAAVSARDDIMMAEYAYSIGVSIDEDDEAKIESTVSAISASAAGAGLDIGVYLRKNYGSLITEDTVREACRLHCLAVKGKAALSAGTPHTDDELEEYCKENYSSFYGADYMTLVVEAGDEFDNAKTEEEKNAAYKKAYSNALGINNAVYDRASFEAEAEKYYRSIYDVIENGTQTSDGQINEAELSQKVAECAVIGAPYSYMDSIDAFLFSEERVRGEHYMYEERDIGRITLYFMLEPLHRDEEECVSVRYIFMSDEIHDDLNKDIYEAYNAWLQDGAGEEVFTSLVGRYSEDMTATSGGLAEFVGKDGMDAAISEWCFDPERKAGDADVIMAENGAYFIYFISYNEVKWKAQAEKPLDDKAYEERVSELYQKYSIDVHEDTLKNLPELLGE